MRIALLTNFIPPYRVPLLKALAAQIDSLRILISTSMEPNRLWQPTWGDLDVVKQRCWTIQQTWRHPQGFEEPSYVHIPYDTLGQLRRYQPDLVISGEMGLRTLLAVIYCKLHRTTPLILWLTASEHTEQQRGPARKILRRWLFRQVDAVLVNGESGARYAKRFGLTDDAIFMAPYTPDFSRLPQVPLQVLPEQAYHLLYVGQLTQRKGLFPFLEILERWAAAHPDRQIVFQLVGEGPLKNQLQALTLPNNVTIHMAGHVPFNEMASIYERGGIFVFPSLADEWGLVVNEAMAAGLPVLGSRYSQAVEELVEEGYNGWTFRPDQPEEMYTALTKALNTSVDELHQMRQCARATALALTPEHVADNMMQAARYVSPAEFARA